MPNFSKKKVVGAIFFFHGFKKGTLWAPFSRSMPPEAYDPQRGFAIVREPVFHETIIITVPIGPSV